MNYNWPARPKRLFRYSLLTLFACVTIVSFGLGSCVVTQRDKVRATQAIVAWIVGGTPISGFDDDYPDSDWMRSQRQFFVVCDYLPSSVSVSSDPRVKRIRMDEYEATFAKHGFDHTDYLVIEVKDESAFRMTLDMANRFGTLAAHGYVFEFRKRLFRLKCSGKLSWVS